MTTQNRPLTIDYAEADTALASLPLSESQWKKAREHLARQMKRIREGYEANAAEGAVFRARREGYQRGSWACEKRWRKREEKRLAAEAVHATILLPSLLPRVGNA